MSAGDENQARRSFDPFVFLARGAVRALVWPSRKGTPDVFSPTASSRRLHAAGQHSYRRLAISRGMAGHEFQFRTYQGIDPKTGTREVRRVFHGRSHGRAEHADGRAEKKSHRDLVRAVHAVVSVVAGHRAHRSGRHRLDHIRRALSHRAPLRLARPPEQRPRRLEYRHHVKSGRGAQFRARRAYGARRPVSPRARIL